jgi:hypothetical protein
VLLRKIDVAEFPAFGGRAYIGHSRLKVRLIRFQSSASFSPSLSKVADCEHIPIEGSDPASLSVVRSTRLVLGMMRGLVRLETQDDKMGNDRFAPMVVHSGRGVNSQ